MTPTGGRRAIVLTNGDAAPRAVLDAAWPGWTDGVDLVIAADGGARHAAPLGLRIDAWIGDGDSLSDPEIDALASAGVAIRRVPADKDETDTELAIVAAVESGAADLTILGALGGIRTDHALANLLLLAHPALAGRTARILGESGTRASLVTAPAPDGRPVERLLAGQAGDLVSLLPLFGPVTGVRTDGLRYPLRGETLEVGPARGISNVRLGPTARLEVGSGRLLVLETPATVGP